MKRGLLALPALAVAVLGVFASSGGSAVADEATINVRAGDGEVGYAVNTFLPQSVYLRVGDTVTWQFPWDEPHSVTFGEITGNPDVPSNPDEAVPEYDGTGFLNSGLIFGTPEAPTFSVKFTAEGTFDYYCFIHPFMTGQVVIQGPGIGEQDNQASVDARGAATYTSSINELKAAAGAASAKPVAISSKVGGGKKYTLTVSSLTDITSGDVMQFFPAKFNVNVNDEVEFVSTVATPHDMIFTPPGVTSPPARPPERRRACWSGTRSPVATTTARASSSITPALLPARSSATAGPKETLLRSPSRRPGRTTTPARCMHRRGWLGRST